MVHTAEDERGGEGEGYRMKVDRLGWAGPKVSMSLFLVLYVLLDMREGVKEKATVPRWIAWAGQDLRLACLSSWCSGGAVCTAGDERGDEGEGYQSGLPGLGRD